MSKTKRAKRTKVRIHFGRAVKYPQRGRHYRETEDSRDHDTVSTPEGYPDTYWGDVADGAHWGD